MADFLIKQLPYDLSSHAGLAFIGKYLKRINVNALIDPAFPVRSGIANSCILKSYLGLLCLGKNDFDAIENFRGNAFFMRALGLQAAPSSPTLRQRLDTHARDWFELVGRTYAGVDGYCPLAVYLGRLGYCLELALRPGGQPGHRPVAGARRCGLLLLETDAGNLRPRRGLWARDGLDHQVEPARKTPVETVAAGKVADANASWQTLRPGKRECVWQEGLDLVDVGNPANRARRVYRLSERTIDKYGNALLLPQQFSAAQIIALYRGDEPVAPDRTKHAQRARCAPAPPGVPGLGASDSGFAVFDRHYGQLRTASPRQSWGLGKTMFTSFKT